jgi:glycerol uptake facilitator-like aquaporin
MTAGYFVACRMSVTECEVGVKVHRRQTFAYANISAMRSIVAEGIGTALLVAAIVGSGIMGERLAGGNAALALLANSVATGAVLVTLIFTFAPISGAHFNPAVSLAAAAEGGLPWRRVPGYVAAQIGGAIAGVIVAHAMFEHPLLALSRHSRVGPAQLFSELVATFGLLVVIHGTGKHAAVVPLTVAAYITAAYWFTSSTSFANPAVTIARGLTDTFSGIAPEGIPGFIGAQLAGALAATLLFRWLSKS